MTHELLKVTTASRMKDKRIALAAHYDRQLESHTLKVSARVFCPRVWLKVHVFFNLQDSFSHQYSCVWDFFWWTLSVPLKTRKGRCQLSRLCFGLILKMRWPAFTWKALRCTCTVDKTRWPEGIQRGNQSSCSSFLVTLPDTGIHGAILLGTTRSWHNCIALYPVSQA